VKSALSFDEQWAGACERFWSKVQVTETCWLWTDELVDGYAQFFMGGQVQRAHRIAYRVITGPIPAGFQVDHRCRVKHCVNPGHLRLATNKQNMENLGLDPRSTSGYRGVTQISNGRWKAQLGHNGVRFYLGLHDTPEQAHEVAKAKRLELFTYNEADRD